jgi:hypothetical protein
MAQGQPYTIHFIYEIVEDAVRFHLQATVTPMPDATWLVDNIRHTDGSSGISVPPVSLKKGSGSWIDTHGNNTTPLSLAIGKAIDSHET